MQYTAVGFGWVVVHLDGIERDELAELTFEAWRLTAPTAALVEAGRTGSPSEDVAGGARSDVATASSAARRRRRASSGSR